MGDRRNIIVGEGPGKPAVSLYTHWSGTEAPETLANALDRGRSRWGDTEYLARIIFDEMTKDAHGELTGYGIGVSTDGVNASCEASKRDLIVNDNEQTVTTEYDTRTYEEFINIFKTS